MYRHTLLSLLAAALGLTAACGDGGPALPPESTPTPTSTPGEAALTVEPSELDLGLILIGETGSETVTITNSAPAGSAKLTVRNVRLAPTFGPFEIVSQPSLPQGLEPGESLEVEISYLPTVHYAPDETTLVVEYGAVDKAEVPVHGRGAECMPLSSRSVLDAVPLTARDQLVASNGIDDELSIEFNSDGNWQDAVRFNSSEMDCVWVEPGTTVSLSGSSDLTAPWSVDDVLVIEVLDESGARLGWGYLGNYSVTGVRDKVFGTLVPQLGTATITAEGQLGPFGYPADGPDAADLAPLFDDPRPRTVRVYALDGMIEGYVEDLYLFAGEAS